MARKAAEHEHCSCVEQLEDDVRVLKRQLARRGHGDPLAASGLPVKRTGGGQYGLDNLHDQDRKFIERRLGVRR